MRYSRVGIVAVLLAAEVFVGGAILWALGAGRIGEPVQGATLVNRMHEQAKIDAGASPHVVIEDPSERVVVSAATDGKVHVTDHTHVWGWLLGSRPDSTVHVSRTADGVAIRRGDGQPQPAVAMLGIYFQRTEVGVPPGTLVDIRSCDGASLSGVRADDVRIACDDGSLHLDDVQSASIDAVTKGGSIHASDLNVRGGRLETGSGDIHVALLDPDLRLHAQTGDGRIRINGHRVANNYQPGGIDYRFGSGDGSLDITTQDGSIRITSNGAH